MKNTMYFPNFSSGDHFILLSGTICAILVEGFMRNICVQLFRIWTNGSKIFSIFNSDDHFVLWSKTISATLVEGNICVKLF